MADQTTTSAKKLGKEISETGTMIYAGHITGEEYNPKVSGRQAIRTFDIMRRSDATVRATLQVCKLPILALTWKLNPAKKADGTIDPKDEMIAKYVEAQLLHNTRFSFFDFSRQALTMFDFGFSVFEKVYEPIVYEGSTYIGLAKLGYRKQVSIQSWETVDEKPGITQQLMTKVVSIPREKLIVFTYDKEGDNYEGTSLLRAAYKHWDIKDKLDRVNAVALEKLAMGVPVLKKPETADQTELVRARTALQNFRANEQGYQEIPVGWELEMLDMKANSTKDVIPTIQYHDRQIMKSVLAQFLELGASDASGSRAVSEDHSKLFLLSEESAAKIFKQTIQEEIVKQLCDLNFSNLENGYPELEYSKIGDDNVVTISEAVSKLISAGAITADQEVERDLRRMLNLSEMTSEVIEQWDRKTEEAKNPPTTPDKDTSTQIDKSKKQDSKDLKASLEMTIRARNRLATALIGA